MVEKLPYRKLAAGLLLWACILAGCSPTASVYRNTPYETYLDFNWYGLHDSEPAYDINILTARAERKPSNFGTHWGIARWAFSHNHLGSALFALKQADQIRPKDPKVNFNIAVILSCLGLNDAAKGRFMYIEKRSTDYFLKNRAVAAMLNIESKGNVSRDYFIENY